MTPDCDTGYQPANELEHALARCLLTGARASWLRTLARSTVCVPAASFPAGGRVADPAGPARAGRGGRTEPVPGPIQVPCAVDEGGRHALIYTSYQQLAGAYGTVLAEGQGPAPTLPWYEVPVAALFTGWPADVDVWVNAGGALACPLGPEDIGAVAAIAAGGQVTEAYEVGPEDAVTDFPGPRLPDRVDCAIAGALIDVPEVLEVFRAFRRLDEPQGRTWRLVLVLTDGGRHTTDLARVVVDAVNAVSDECCEVHVADVRADDVYDAVAPVMRLSVPLWRRDGFTVPDTPEEIDRLDARPNDPPGLTG